MPNRGGCAPRHQHHFEDLSPDDFERLVYWLVERSGEFDQVPLYGGARDKGRDVVAYKHAAEGADVRGVLLQHPNGNPRRPPSF